MKTSILHENITTPVAPAVAPYMAVNGTAAVLLIRSVYADRIAAAAAGAVIKSIPSPPIEVPAPAPAIAGSDEDSLVCG